VLKSRNIRSVQILLICNMSYINFSKGSRSGNSGRCNGCHGSGVRIVTRQIGPGMIQQMQHVCSDCRGSGLFFLQHFSSSPSASGGQHTGLCRTIVYLDPWYLFVRLP
jgi:DnaJ-class molecular chaperone